MELDLSCSSGLTWLTLCSYIISEHPCLGVSGAPHHTSHPKAPAWREVHVASPPAL